jgi:CheY-like chemotaxis protein
LGYRTEAAASGAEALKMLANGLQCDLLFTDLVMPGGMTGFQLAATARHRRPDLKILLTTGFARVSDQAPETVPHAVLRKPYRHHQLATAIRAALDGVDAGDMTDRR